MATGFYNLSKKLKSWYKNAPPPLKSKKKCGQKKLIKKKCFFFPCQQTWICNRIFSFLAFLQNITPKKKAWSGSSLHL
jgi:hypothetical protein